MTDYDDHEGGDYGYGGGGGVTDYGYGDSAAGGGGGGATDYDYGDGGGGGGGTDYSYGYGATGTGGGTTDYSYDTTGGGGGDFNYGYDDGPKDGDDDIYGLGGGAGGQDFYGGGGNTLQLDDDQNAKNTTPSDSSLSPSSTPQSRVQSAQIRQSRSMVVVKEVGIPLEDDPMVAEELHTLRSHHLFRNVYWNDFYKIATKWLDRFRISKDTVLSRQGSSVVGGTHYCIISKGLVDVVRSGITLTTLTVGDSFGEAEMVYGQPASSTLICKSYVEAWGIQREVLERLKSSHQVRRRKFDENDPV